MHSECKKICVQYAKQIGQRDKKMEVSMGKI